MDDLLATWSGWTPLHMSSFGTEPDSHLIYDSLDEVNKLDESGRSPLQIAIENQNSSMICLLVKHSASFDHVEINGIKGERVFEHPHYFELGIQLLSTVPMTHKFLVLASSYAGYTDQPELMELITRNRSFCSSIFNCYDFLGLTPIHYAAIKGSSSCASIMINNGGIVTQWSKTDFSYPAHYACSHGHEDMIELFQRSSPDGLAETINSQDLRGRTPFHSALYGRQWKLLSSFSSLLQSCDSSLLDFDGHSVPGLLFLMRTSCFIPREFAMLIPCLTQDESDWMLHAAISDGDDDLVCFALEQNANVNCLDLMQQSPIISAAKLGQSVVCLLLLENGADQSIGDYNGYTALHYSSRNGHLEVTKILLQFPGSDSLLLSVNEYTPLDLAFIGSHLDVACELLQSMKQISSNILPHWVKTLELAMSCATESVLRSLICHLPSDWITRLVNLEVEIEKQVALPSMAHRQVDCPILRKYVPFPSLRKLFAGDVKNVLKVRKKHKDHIEDAKYYKHMSFQSIFEFQKQSKKAFRIKHCRTNHYFPIHEALNAKNKDAFLFMFKAACDAGQVEKFLTSKGASRISVAQRLSEDLPDVINECNLENKIYQYLVKVFLDNSEMSFSLSLLHHIVSDCFTSKKTVTSHSKIHQWPAWFLRKHLKEFCISVGIFDDLSLNNLLHVTQLVQKIFDNNHLSDASDGDVSLLLYCAAANGVSPEIFEILLDGFKSFDLTTEALNHRWAFTEAIRRNHYDLARLLLVHVYDNSLCSNHNDNDNEFKEEVMFSFHHISSAHEFDFALQVLKSFSEEWLRVFLFNARYGERLLYLSLSCGEVSELGSFLIQKYINVLHTVVGKEIVHYEIDMIPVIINQAYRNFSLCRGNSLLELLDKLVKLCKSIEWNSFCPSSVLRRVCAYGESDVLNAIMEYGNLQSSDFISNQEGFTPLYCAIVGGHLDIVSMILSKYPSVLDDQNTTCLLGALFHFCYSNYVRNTKYFKGVLERFEKDWVPIDVSVNIHNGDPSFAEDFLQLLIANYTNITIHEKFADWLVCLVLHVPNISSIIARLEDNFVKTMFTTSQQSWFFSTVKYSAGLQNFSDWVLIDAFWFNASHFNEEFAYLLENLFSRFPPFNPVIAVRKGYRKSLVQGVMFLNDFAHSHEAYGFILKNWQLAVIDIIKVGDGELAITILKCLTAVATFNQTVFDLEKLLKVSVQVARVDGFSSVLLEYLLEFHPQAKVLFNTVKCAARKGNVEAMKVLVAYDRSIIESDFTAILHSASESGQSGIVDYFYENRFYDFLHENLAYYHSLDTTFWMTVFQDAVHSGQKDLALYALGKLPFSAMASLASSTDTIHDICWWGMTDVLTTLCIDDARVFFYENHIDLYGCSPFQAALDSGHIGVMTECESFPLFIDVLSSSDIELMLENSLSEFDLITRFSYGWLNRNTNDNEESKEYQLHASYAVRKCILRKLPNLCYFLEQLAVVNGYPIVNSYIETWGKHASGVLYYLYKKHSINVLELAVDGGNVQTVQIILQILFDAQVLSKLTTLDIFRKALLKNDVEILTLVKQFCDEQIVAELKNDYEETILHIASEYSQSSQCSEILLSMIRSHLPRLSNCVDTGGMNPLDCAIKLGRFYVAREIMSFTAHIVSLKETLSRGTGWFSLLMEFNSTNVLRIENEDSQPISKINAFNELPSLRDKDVSEYYKEFKNYHPGIVESIMTASCDTLPLHGLDYTHSSLMGYDFSTKKIKWSRNQLMDCMQQCELLDWCKKRQFQCIINILEYIISNDETDLLDATGVNYLFVTACSKSGLSLVKYMINSKGVLAGEEMLSSSTIVEGFVTAIGLGYLEIAAYIMLNAGVSQRVLQKEMLSACEPTFLVNLIFFTPAMDVLKILQDVVEQGVSSRILASQTWLMHNWGQYQIELIEKRISRASLHSQQFEIELREPQRLTLCIDLSCFPDIDTVSCPFPKLAVVLSACVSHLVPIGNSLPLFPLINVPEDGTLTLSYNPYSASPRYDISSYNYSIVLALDQLNQLFVWPLPVESSPSSPLDVESTGLKHLFTIPCKELMEMSCKYHILKAKLPIPIAINLDSIGNSCNQSFLNTLMQCVNDTLNAVKLYYYKYALYTELGLLSKEFLNDYQYKSLPMKSPLIKLLTNLSIEIDCSDASEIQTDLDNTGNLKVYIGIESNDEGCICPFHYQITEAVGSLLVKSDLLMLSNELSLYIESLPYSFTVCHSRTREHIVNLAKPSDLVLKDIVILRFLPYIKQFITLVNRTFISCSVPSSEMSGIKIFFDISLHRSYFDTSDNSLKIAIFDILPHRRKNALAFVVPELMKSVHSSGLYSATAISSYIDESENFDFFSSQENGIARVCNLQGERMETVSLKCMKDPREHHLYRASALVDGVHVRNSPLVFQWKIPKATPNRKLISKAADNVHKIQFIVSHPGGGCSWHSNPLIVMNSNYISIREQIPALKGLPSKTTLLLGKDKYVHHIGYVYGKEVRTVIVPGSIYFLISKNIKLRVSKCLPMARGMYQVILQSVNSFVGSVVAVCSKCECALRIHTKNGYSFSQDVKFPSGPISLKHSYVENIEQLRVMAGSGLAHARIVLRDSDRNDCTLDMTDDIPQVILQYGTEMLKCTTELVSVSVISITIPPLCTSGKYSLHVKLNDTSQPIGTVVVRSGMPHPPNCTIKGTTLVDGRHVLKTDISTGVTLTVALFDEHGNSCDSSTYCNSVSARIIGSDQFIKFKVSSSKRSNEIVLLCQSINDMSFTSVVVKVMNQTIPNMPISLEYSFNEVSFLQRCSMLFTSCNKVSERHQPCVITWDGSLNSVMEALQDTCVARPVKVVKSKSNKDNLTRRFFTELTKDIVSPQHWLFSCTATGLYRPLPQSFPSSCLEYFEFVGRMLATAIVQGCYIEVEFSVGVYKTILGESFTMKDMEKEDVALYRCLDSMAKCSCQNELIKVVRESKLANATYQTVIDSLMKERNESYISFETKEVYIKRFVQHYLCESVEQLLLAIKRGFLSVTPQTLLYFNHEELRTILTGNKTVNVARLKSKTVYLLCKETDMAVVNLWKVILNMKKEEFVALLQTSTTTGYSSIPLSNSWVWPVYGDCYYRRLRAFGVNSSGVHLPLLLTSEEELHRKLMTCLKLRLKN